MLVTEDVFNQKVGEFLSDVERISEQLSDRERSCLSEIQQHRENYFKNMDDGAYQALRALGAALMSRQSTEYE